MIPKVMDFLESNEGDRRTVPSAHGKTPDYMGAIGNLFRRKNPGRGSQQASYDPAGDRSELVPMSAQQIPGEAGQTHNQWASPEDYQDSRGLIPPEPMARALVLLSEIPIGHVAVVHNDRVPGFLLAQLDLDRMPYVMESDSDGSTIVRILKVREYDFLP